MLVEYLGIPRLLENTYFIIEKIIGINLRRTTCPPYNCFSSNLCITLGEQHPFARHKRPLVFGLQGVICSKYC